MGWEDASSHELAWAAGFFDGEGSTSVHTGSAGDYGYLVVQVSQKDPQLLHRWVAAVGAGKVYGPYVSADDKCKVSAFSDDAQVALLRMWPFLGEPKRLQARRACAIVNAKRAGVRKTRAAAAEISGVLL